MNKFSGESFECDRGCKQLIFWKENEHIFINMYDGLGGERGNRHACPNRGGWNKDNGSTGQLEERKITEKDLEIAQCNPTKHKYIREILDSIHGSVYSDMWLCSECKDHGDKWYMMVHDCKGYYRALYEAEQKAKGIDTKKKRKKVIIRSNASIL